MNRAADKEKRSMDRIVKGTQRTGRLAAFRVLWGIAVFCAGILLMGSLECQAREWTGQEGQMAEAVYTNPDTGYQVYVEDEAELLTEAERRELSQAMEEITAYGNAAFVTTGENNRSTERFARNYYTDRFGTDSGTVFVIDMDNRMIWIHSDGAIYKVVTTAYANTVTDNVYRYASEADYYGCAREAFRQIYALLDGAKIAQPMKYISNGLLAMILALLANFGLVISFTKLKKPGADVLLENIHRRFAYYDLRALKTHQTKYYDPVSSSSGGGGSSKGSSGGGGRSGGGGGHRF